MRRALPIVPAPLRRWAAIGGMRRWSAVAALAIALAAAGCGDDEDAPQVADFVPAARTPAVGQVWIVEEGVAGAFVVALDAQRLRGRL